MSRVGSPHVQGGSIVCLGWVHHMTRFIKVAYVKRVDDVSRIGEVT
jgi:hypothetical protein